MSVLDSFLFAVAIIAAQIVLGAALFAVFMWMRIVERDTRLPEEAGGGPDLEFTGGGRIGRSGWSRRPFCRISLYNEFLVVSVRSTRRLLRYDEIASVEITQDKKRNSILIIGKEARGASALEIEFSAKEHESLLTALRGKVAAA